MQRLCHVRVTVHEVSEGGVVVETFSLRGADTHISKSGFGIDTEAALGMLPTLLTQWIEEEEREDDGEDTD